jgi:hypothetical protein
VHDGGAKALHHIHDAVRGDPFLLACPRRLSVPHGPAVWIAAAFSDSFREDTKAACDKLTRARFGRRVLTDGADRASSTAYADRSNECGQNFHFRRAAQVDGLRASEASHQFAPR